MGINLEFKGLNKIELFEKNGIFSTDINILSLIKNLKEFRPVVAELFHAVRKHRSDMEKLIVPFRKFAQACIKEEINLQNLCW